MGGRALALLIIPLACRAAMGGVPPGRTVRIGVDDSAPYQEWVAGRGPQGLSVDVLNEAARRRGVTLRWSYHPEGPQVALSERRVDVWPLVTARQDVPYPHLTEPWLRNEMALVGAAGSEWFQKDAWQRARIAHLGFSATVAIVTSRLPEAERLPHPTRAAAFEAFCRGEADVFLVEARTLEALLLKRPAACEGKALRARIVPEASFPLATAALSEFAAVADELRAEISRMTADGTLSRLMNQWLVMSGVEARQIAEIGAAEQRAKVGLLGAGILGALLVLVTALNAKLRGARLAAERANEAKSRFLANVSHELRTPLAGIIGMTELLLEGQLEDQEKQRARIVLHSARHLHELLDDLLDLSKAEAGKVTLGEKPFSPRALLEELAGLFEPRAREKGLDYRVVFESHLPENLAGDAKRVRQVISNLLSNALKFTERGSIEMLSTWVDGHWVVRVKDTGIGIPEDKLDLLFRKFSQVDASASRRAAGTGLGLAISRHLARAMGGEIQVSSKEGEGSTFTLTLPLPTVVEAQPAVDTRTEVKALSALCEDQPKVLLAEDNPVNRHLMTVLLARLGCAVEAAHNGREAVEKARSAEYRAVFMDCQMPEMDGFEASRAIRASGSRVPIVAITASAFESDREQCLESGMDAVLAKPIQREELERVVQQWVRTQRGPTSSAPG